MKHPANQALFDHWQSLRRGRQVPDRNHLDPAAIRHVLSYTFMLEVDAKAATARRYPVRVSGTRLDALFGMSVKDLGFATLWQPHQRGTLRLVTEAVLDEGRPAVIGGAAAPSGYPPVTVEMLMLPLRCQGQTHARLFCSLVPLNPPTWLGLESVEPLDLLTWRLIETGADQSAAGLTTPQPWLALGTAPVRRPRLTLIPGGKSSHAADTVPLLQQPIKAGVQESAHATLPTWSS